MAAIDEWAPNPFTSQGQLVMDWESGGEAYYETDDPVLTEKAAGSGTVSTGGVFSSKQAVGSGIFSATTTSDVPVQPTLDKTATAGASAVTALAQTTGQAAAAAQQVLTTYGGPILGTTNWTKLLLWAGGLTLGAALLYYVLRGKV